VSSVEAKRWVAQVLLVLLLIAALSGTACSTSGRDSYINKNEQLLQSLPRYPGTVEVGMSSAEVREEEEGPVTGFTTTASFELPEGTTAEEVERFYRRRLTGQGWMLEERVSGPGPILKFRRRQEMAVVNLEGWRGAILDVVVDHGA